MTIETRAAAAGDGRRPTAELAKDNQGETLIGMNGNPIYSLHTADGKTVFITSEQYVAMVENGELDVPHSRETVVDEFPNTPLAETNLARRLDSGTVVPDDLSSVDPMTGWVRYRPESKQPQTEQSDKRKKRMIIGGAVAGVVGAVVAGGVYIGTRGDTAPTPKPTSISGEQTPGGSSTEGEGTPAQQLEQFIAEHPQYKDLSPELQAYAFSLSPEELAKLDSDEDRVAAFAMPNLGPDALSAENQEKTAQQIADIQGVRLAGMYTYGTDQKTVANNLGVTLPYDSDSNRETLGKIAGIPLADLSADYAEKHYPEDQPVIWAVVGEKSEESFKGQFVDSFKPRGFATPYVIISGIDYGLDPNAPENQWDLSVEQDGDVTEKVIGDNTVVVTVPYHIQEKNPVEEVITRMGLNADPNAQSIDFVQELSFTVEIAPDGTATVTETQPGTILVP